MSGGRREKAKTGGFSGGPPQYGYVSQDHKLVIDEDQANVVRKIFVLRAQRWALQEIADKLNETSTTRRGKAWQPKQVSTPDGTRETNQRSNFCRSMLM